LADGGAVSIASAKLGDNKPVAIASATHATTTATITTVQAHGFKVGMIVVVKGFTDANFNRTATILTVPSATTFTYTMAGTPSVDTIVKSLSSSILVDSTKAWTTNQWAGYMCYMTTSTVTAASGAATGQCMQIASNDGTSLTFVTAGTAPVTLATSYAIVQQPVRGLGIALAWGFGLSDFTMKGKYLFVARGGGVVGFDRLDITTDTFELMPITPQIETLSTGSMYAYDGIDRLYFTKEATLRMYYLDLVTNTVNGAGIIPYVAGTATIGNRMEIFTTEDGLKYLWVNRHSATDCFRSLLFW
jgi:hypothetical protein